MLNPPAYNPSAMNLGFQELLVILVVVLVLFGPRQLPRLARALGEAVKEFQRVRRELEETLKEEHPRDPGS